MILLGFLGLRNLVDIVLGLGSDLAVLSLPVVVERSVVVVNQSLISVDDDLDLALDGASGPVLDSGVVDLVLGDHLLDVVVNLTGSLGLLVFERSHLSVVLGSLFDDGFIELSLEGLKIIHLFLVGNSVKMVSCLV